MTKLIIIPSNDKMIKKSINSVAGYILSVRGLSTNSLLTYDLNELKEVINYLNDNNKEVFISLNKNMHNSDLEYLEEVLKAIDNYNIKGLLYYDIAIVNIHQRLNLKTALVWAQEHFTTNSTTCNYWFNNGVKYSYISADITLNEIENIKKNTAMVLMVPVFGYLPMMVSKRRLVKNYLDYSNISNNSVINYMQAGDKRYLLVDDAQGTYTYSAHILNGLKAYLRLKEIGINYVTLNAFNIKEEAFLKVIKLFNNVNDDNLTDYMNKIEKMFDNTNYGFLYQTTIYKVKKNEE